MPTTTWGIPRSAGPAGLVSARVADVLAFVRLHLSGGVAPNGSRLLSEASVEAMTRDEARLPDRYTLGDSWGLGWIRFGWGDDRLVGHDGATIGQGAFLRVLPSQGVAVSLLTNGGRPRDLFEDVVREVFDELAGVTMQPPVAPADEMFEVDTERYVGRYERIGVTTEVFEHDGGLRAPFDTHGRVRRAHAEPHARVRAPPGRARRLRDAPAGRLDLDVRDVLRARRRRPVRPLRRTSEPARRQRVGAWLTPAPKAEAGARSPTGACLVHERQNRSALAGASPSG